jgi:hypothetical protein
MKEEAREFAPLLFLVALGWKGFGQHTDNEETVRVYEADDCGGQDYGIPYQDDRCAYIGNMGSFRFNYP